MRLLAIVIAASTVACSQAASPAPPCVCPCAAGSASIAASSSPSPLGAPQPAATAVASDDVAALVAAQKADEYVHSAQRKLAWHDGVGCLADLDAHDKIDTRPEHASTAAVSGFTAILRAECLLRAGRCDAGRALLHDAYADSQGKNISAMQLDRVVDTMVGQQCTAPVTPRDRFLVARMTLQEGAWTTTRTADECRSAYTTIMALRTTVTPRDADDTLVADPLSFVYVAAPSCLARAGDCTDAYRVYREVAAAKFGAAAWTSNPTVMRSTFESVAPRCRGT